MGSEGRNKGKQLLLLLHIYDCIHAFEIAFRFTSVNYAGRGQPRGALTGGTWTLHL